MQKKGDAKDLGAHVFILRGADEAGKGLSWHAISQHEKPGVSYAGGNPSDEVVPARLQASEAFRAAMKKSMHPGMVLIVTDNLLHPDRRSGEDFVIMSS